MSRPTHYDGRKTHQTGFTLIELLIVVGILAMLSGLAAENYLAASTRAKVARVRADLRTYATAIEAYTVDRGQVPRMRNFRFYRDPCFDVLEGEHVHGILSQVLTTPVAYVHSVLALDPFMTVNKAASLSERLYTYQDIDAYAASDKSSKFWPAAAAYYGPWRMASVGPDQTFSHGFANSAQLPYDPTNGLISFGNIWAGQRLLPETLPPIPELLGSH